MARNYDTKLTVDCPEDFSSEERRALAEKVMDFISERTKSGRNVFGRDWAGAAGRYSSSYARLKGVSTGGPVDLANSHDMLDDMTYLGSDIGEITVGYEDGTKSEAKAEGNILGSYGRNPNPKKARPFLDILQKDLQDLISEVIDERGD